MKSKQVIWEEVIPNETKFQLDPILTQVEDLFWEIQPITDLENHSVLRAYVEIDDHDTSPQAEQLKQRVQDFLANPPKVHVGSLLTALDSPFHQSLNRIKNGESSQTTTPDIEE